MTYTIHIWIEYNRFPCLELVWEVLVGAAGEPGRLHVQLADRVDGDERGHPATLVRLLDVPHYVEQVGKLSLNFILDNLLQGYCILPFYFFPLFSLRLVFFPPKYITNSFTKVLDFTLNFPEIIPSPPQYKYIPPTYHSIWSTKYHISFPKPKTFL